LAGYLALRARPHVRDIVVAQYDPLGRCRQSCYCGVILRMNGRNYMKIRARLTSGR
jgi:hypothetical protein